MQRLLALMFIFVFTTIASCANQTTKFETLSKRDKLFYTACRHDVVRNYCPDDPDCDIKAAEKYAQEPYSARRQWLLDYGCPMDKLQKVHDMVEKQERESTGM